MRTKQQNAFILKRRQWLLIGLLMLIVFLSTASLHFIKEQSSRHQTQNKKKTVSVVTLNDKTAESGSIEQLVNKEHPLPSNYVPSDLVNLSLKSVRPVRMRKEAAEALSKMFDAASRDGITLSANSGYRSYADQKTIFDRHVQNMGEAKANAISSKPGESEHQTGLAVDLTCAELNGDLQETFANTNAGKWVAAHAQDYGYIIRFPKGSEKITGYTYEPWHLRYIGVDLAKKVKKSGLCYEAYLNKYGKQAIK